jgi:prolyl 4-hydroxylase
MGGMFGPEDDFSMPQLVRYGTSQRFDQHMDWFPQLQLSKFTLEDGSMVDKNWNRMTSFFVFVKARCTGGDTHFPKVKLAASSSTMIGGQGGRLASKDAQSMQKFREHEDGGVAFKPIEGNALFWVNLKPNGAGDNRVVHAGLPLDSGVKVGMNIWPRKVFPRVKPY